MDQTGAPEHTDGSTRARARRDEKRRGGKARSAVTELVFVVVAALVISALIRAFLGQMFIIPSESMEHTLMVGDKVVVSKVTDFKRGDAVVFADPANWITTPPQQRGTVGHFFELVGVLPDTSKNYLVKRVIGMPGDHVVCCDKQGKITVNGKALDEQAYVWSQSGKPSDFNFSVVVPKDRVFVMGDHRDDSADSRCHLNEQPPAGEPKGMAAFVPIANVQGPVVAVALPVSHFSTEKRPSTFQGVPSATSIPDNPTFSVSPPGCG